MTTWLFHFAAWLAFFVCSWSATAQGQDAARISFFSEKVTLREGSSQVIAFKTEKPALTRRVFSFRADKNAVRWLMPPTQLAGESIGYLRVVGLRPGVTTLEAGRAKLAVTIVANHEAMEAVSLEIVTPVRGTVVWGKFAVGVEQFNSEIAGETPAVILRLPNGKELSPHQPIGTMAAPAQRVFFEVDAAQLALGPNELVAVMKNAYGSEERSAPLQIVRKKNDPDLIAAGECRDKVNGPRPKHAGEGEIKLVDDPDYPDGKVVASIGETPTWALPVTIEKEGAYQMFVTARGNPGGGALPTIGVVLDDGDKPETTARLAANVWHRIAVGHPFLLSKGEHLLAVRFRNDFSRGAQNDRDLFLGHYELARVEAMPARPLSVTFESPLNSRHVTGAVDLSASCLEENEAPPPRVKLFVNERLIAQAESTRADFHVSANAFHAGKNSIFLEATTTSGERARSVTEHLLAPEDWQPASQERAGWPADVQPPAAKIAYPAEGQLLGQADAVVADVSDDRAIASVDLRIDGKPQQLNLPTEQGFGPVLLPLLTRELAPGGHRLEVEVRDSSGNVALSPVINFRVAPVTEKFDGPYQRAVFLLNRFGYGPEPRELAEILTRSPRAWLQARLYEKSDSAKEQNLAQQLGAAFPKDRDDNQVVGRAFKYLLATGNPVRARFVMWAENHFSTWMNKIGPLAKANEHRRFSAIGLAPFFDLLLASATSPAMMIYLDQPNSVSGTINENYAREIMELHTLGVKGGYTQKDVTTLADLLSGCGVADEAGPDGSGEMDITFRFDASSSSEHFCQVLGMEFPSLTKSENFDRVRLALETLAAHPSCAEFVSRRLAEHYAAVPAPPLLVKDLTKVFRETGGDLREVLLALSEHPDFLHAKPRVASPIDYAVRAARMVRLQNPEIVREFAATSGMGMFDRATPDGYPESDADFSSSNALLQRWHFAQKREKESATPEDVIPKSWEPAPDQQTPESLRRLIDRVALRLTGNVLSEATTSAALQLLQDAPTKPEARLALLIAFVGQSPEGSLR